MHNGRQGTGQGVCRRVRQQGDLSLPIFRKKHCGNFHAAWLQPYNVYVCHYCCDLTDQGSRNALFEHMKLGGFSFNFLINIAGLDYEGPFEERTPEQIRTILRLNIEANLEVTSAVLKLRDRSRTFRIINVASLAAYYPMPAKAIYASSKRFLLDFSRALREEIRPLDATVTAVCPAGLPTTPGCIKAIEAQGIAGLYTECGFVAMGAINSALKAGVYITWSTGCLKYRQHRSTSMVVRVVGSRWKAARRMKMGSG